MLARIMRAGRIAGTSSVLLVTCGLMAAAPGLSLAARPARRTAVVAGSVERCGGPAPGRCQTGKVGFCQAPYGCVTTHRVVAINWSGRRVAVQRLRHGRFSLRLPPGLYRIELLGDGPRVRGRVMQHKKVTARAHRTTYVRFVFNVP